MLSSFLSFLLYVCQQFRLVRVAMFSLLLLVVLEYTCMSLLIPLGSNAQAAEGTSNAGAMWTWVATQLGLQPSIVTWLWLFLILLIVRNTVGYLHLLLSVYVSRQVHRHLTEATFNRVLYAEPIDRIYRNSIGYYITLSGDDAFRAGQIINSTLQLMAGATSAVVALAVLYAFSPSIFAGTAAFLVLVGLLIAVFIKKMMQLNAQSVILSRDAHTSFLEALNNLRSMRSMRAEHFASDNYANVIQRYTALLFKIDAIKNGVRFVPGLLALLFAIFYLAPHQPSTAYASGAFILSATMILLRVFAALSSMMTSGGTLLLDLRATKDLTEFTKITAFGKYRSNDPVDVTTLPPIERLTLSNIHFSYTPECPIIKGLHCELRTNCAYAFIGPSGSGKSTLADILLGMIVPSTGSVQLDGCEVNADELRKRVVLVEQEPRVFSVSLRDNLTLGLQRETSAIEDALKAVDLLAFAQQLPAGLDTLMNYQGANLSGGQRQRLAIARAVLRYPQVLILDEATSALDPETSRTVVANLKTLMRGGIIVFITHDESVAQVVDHVLDLSPGIFNIRKAVTTAV